MNRFLVPPELLTGETVRLPAPVSRQLSKVLRLRAGAPLVLFGGDVLRAFSLALFIGVVFGTYSSVAIASPIMVWWEQRLEAANRQAALTFNQPLKGGVRTPAISPRANKRSTGAP